MNKNGRFCVVIEASPGGAFLYQAGAVRSYPRGWWWVAPLGTRVERFGPSAEADHSGICEGFRQIMLTYFTNH
jgi:hypothetical protein